MLSLCNICKQATLYVYIFIIYVCIYIAALKTGIL